MDQAASLPDAASGVGLANEAIVEDDPIFEPSTKRARGCVDDAADANTEKAKPVVDTPSVGKDRGNDDNKHRKYTLLPFYGEHKRAVSSLSFAPTTTSSSSAAAAASSFSRGTHGAMSYNSNAGQLPVLCASASADGCAKVWDLTQSLLPPSSEMLQDDDGDGDNFTISKKKLAQSSPNTAYKLDPKVNLVGHGRGINGELHLLLSRLLRFAFFTITSDSEYDILSFCSTRLDITWSPTASYIATASDDKTLRLWCAETGEAFVEFRGHASFVFSCKFNPQSNLLVSGVRGKKVTSLRINNVSFAKKIACNSIWTVVFISNSSRSTKPSSCGIFDAANALQPCQHIRIL